MHKRNVLSVVMGEKKCPACGETYAVRVSNRHTALNKIIGGEGYLTHTSYSVHYLHKRN